MERDSHTFVVFLFKAQKSDTNTCQLMPWYVSPTRPEPDVRAYFRTFLWLIFHMLAHYQDIFELLRIKIAWKARRFHNVPVSSAMEIRPVRNEVP